MSVETSFLDKMKIQTEVLVPVLNKLRDIYGKKVIDPLVFEAIDEHLKQEYIKKGNRINGSGKQKWIALNNDLMKTIGEDIDLEVVESTKTNMELKTNSCKIADFFLTIGEKELGKHMACKSR